MLQGIRCEDWSKEQIDKQISHSKRMIVFIWSLIDPFSSPDFARLHAARLFVWNHVWTSLVQTSGAHFAWKRTKVLDAQKDSSAQLGQALTSVLCISMGLLSGWMDIQKLDSGNRQESLHWFMDCVHIPAYEHGHDRRQACGSVCVRASRSLRTERENNDIRTGSKNCVVPPFPSHLPRCERNQGLPTVYNGQ